MFLEYGDFWNHRNSRAWTLGASTKSGAPATATQRHREAQRTPVMSTDTAQAGRREGPIALVATRDGPRLHEPDEQALGSITLDIGRELDLAIVIACAQRGAALAEITHQVIARAIAEQPIAFGFEGEGQKCRVCGCGDLHSCWPPCWWVERDLCSRCAQAGLDEVRADVAEGPACTSTESADGTFVDRCARGEARANDIDEAVPA